MVEPVISTGAVVVGASAWFLDKLLGPSMAYLGEQLRLFSSERLSKIFLRAEVIANDEKIYNIPPGFTVQFLQKASVSEDEGSLTEMWANLLVSAATDFSSRHVIFVDILSQINGCDAKQLNGLVPVGVFPVRQISQPVNLKGSLRSQMQNEFRWPAEGLSEAKRKLQAIQEFDFNWPGRVNTVTFPYLKDSDSISHLVGGVPDTNSSFDILSRQGLVDKFLFDLGAPGLSPYVEGVLVTALGVQFTQVCRGKL